MYQAFKVAEAPVGTKVAVIKHGQYGDQKNVVSYGEVVKVLKTRVVVQMESGKEVRYLINRFGEIDGVEGASRWDRHGVLVPADGPRVAQALEVNEKLARKQEMLNAIHVLDVPRGHVAVADIDRAIAALQAHRVDAAANEAAVAAVYAQN